MALTYLRNQFYLHRNKVILFLALALISLQQQAKAQGQLKGVNLPGYEFKRLRWGFSLGMNASWYQLEHSQFYVNRIESDAPYSLNEKTSIGFNVNFITSLRLSPDFVLRAQPGVGYHGRVLEYKGMIDGSGTSERTMLQEMNTFSGEFPLLLKYESKRRRNTQMYFVAGVKPSLMVGGQKKGNPEVLQVRPFDVTIEYGVGLDMFYPFFKFAPEIRYSRGISNIHQPFESVYNNSIQQLNTNTVTLYLNFE